MKIKSLNIWYSVEAFFEWRKKRKEGWRRRFAFIPRRMGLDGRLWGDFIWLERYWLQGRYVPLECEFSDHCYGDYWIWSKQQETPGRDYHE